MWPRVVCVWGGAGQLCVQVQFGIVREASCHTYHRCCLIYELVQVEVSSHRCPVSMYTEVAFMLTGVCTECNLPLKYHYYCCGTGMSFFLSLIYVSIYVSIYITRSVYFALSRFRWVLPCSYETKVNRAAH